MCTPFRAAGPVLRTDFAVSYRICRDFRNTPPIAACGRKRGCCPCLLYTSLSFLMETKHVEGKAAEILSRCPEDIPVYTAELDVLTQLTGFKLTRGMLCAMRRPALKSVAEICTNARRIAVLENVIDVYKRQSLTCGERDQPVGRLQ